MKYIALILLFIPILLFGQTGYSGFNKYNNYVQEEIATDTTLIFETDQSTPGAESIIVNAAAGNVIRLEWGDGADTTITTIGSNQTLSHTYSTSGTYKLKFTKDYKKLSCLNISNCNLTGSIPSEIGNLINLTCLYLSNNQLSGSIPSEIGNLINLTYLCLRYNQLSGSIPSEIGNLINLTYLYLYDNSLSGSILSEIGNLTNLTRLYLHDNLLSGSIPSELGNLTSLAYLYLHNNSLSGSIPSEIGNLTNLTRLYLHNNSLTDYEPVNQSVSIVHYYINDNAITTQADIDSLINNFYVIRHDPSFSLTQLYMDGGTNSTPSAQGISECDSLAAVGVTVTRN
jgi:hypothetical protein